MYLIFKLWQKKTNALEVTGEVNDERFCKREVKFILSYAEEVNLVAILLQHEGVTLLDKASRSIIVDNTKLKEYLIENEIEHKELRSKLDPITRTKPVIIDGSESTALSTDKLSPDEVLLLNTNLKHNTTVMFK